jgi:hypothetical protein
MLFFREYLKRLCKIEMATFNIRVILGTILTTACDFRNSIFCSDNVFEFSQLT